MLNYLKDFGAFFTRFWNTVLCGWGSGEGGVGNECEKNFSTGVDKFSEKVILEVKKCHKKTVEMKRNKHKK